MKRVFLFTALVVQASLAAGQGQNDSDKIKAALSAAPRSVAGQVTVMEWADRRVLREGSNGYFCFAMLPDGQPYPMCIDEAWIGWFEAAVKQEAPPALSRLAIGYWLQGAGGEAEAPHVAILVPDARMLDGVTTDPSRGGPWVMFEGTPYVHLMVPAARPGGK